MKATISMLAKRWVAVLAAMTYLGTSSAPTLADSECDDLRGDERILPGEFVPDLGGAWKSPVLSLQGDVGDALARLDFGEALPLVYSVDLNGDGEAELLLTTPDGKLCGNAGCPYILLAGKTMKQIGEFFGHLAILDERVNGYRIIQSYSRYRVYSSSLDTYVFDGGMYRPVSHALVDACGLEQWSRRLRGDGAEPLVKSK
jgi:hypothetical protein